MSEEQRMNLDYRFRRAMVAAHTIFGTHAFRKFYDPRQARKSPVNKALFESWSVNLDKLDETQLRTLLVRKRRVVNGMMRLMHHPAFFDAISLSTGDPAKVRLRDEAIRTLIREVLGDQGD
jgi:hypothetical protein